MPGILNQRFSSAFFVTLCASSLLALGLLAHPWLRPVAGAAATITVNTTADDDTVNGNCTLREAIQAANTDTAVDACTAGSGTDTIAFAIPGAGLHTIAPTSQLPTITAPVILDGTTQAGASCTTAGGLKIELNGAGTGGGAGLFVTAGNSTVKGLVINRFLSNGVLLLTNGGNTVSCNYIGTDVVGTTDLGNAGNGVAVGDSPNNIIGGTTASAGNLISGNNEEGVLLDGAASTGNQIQGNLIGTNAAGTTALANSFSGVLIRASANGNTVGGTVSSARNVISGNTGLGILIGTNNNTIQGNYVGTNSAGTAAVSNGLTGIELGNGTANNLIGGPTVSTRNLVSGNLGHGIVVNAANNNTVQNNYVGTDATGTTAVGNQFNGISLAGTNNTIGGIGAGNLVSGNGGVGLFLIGASTTGNQVKGNSIGTNAAGTAALANNAGLFMEAGAANNQIGGAAVGEGNLISGNLGSAVAIASCPNTSLQGNLIGTNAAGTAALGNGGAGLDVFGNSPNTLIGGTAAGARNIISANGQFGIGIGGSATTGTQVQGNYIGTDITGTVGLANNFGILISDSPNNVVGGTTASARNLVSGNGGGIQVQGNLATGNLIQGNYVGTNAAGTADLGNSGTGIVLASGAANNLIGGPTAAARNLVSGNDSNGIVVSDASNNTVQNNYVGTDVTGTLDLGNQGAGLAVGNGANNQIGGVGTGNLISGNLVGMQILGAAASGNQVQGNYFGVTASGSVALLNDGTDVAIFDGASNNLLGGTASGAGNVLPNGLTIGGGGATGNQAQGNRIGTNAAGTAVIGIVTHGIVIADAVNTLIGGTAAGARNLVAGSSQNGIWILGSNTTGTQVLGNYIGTDITGTVDLGNGQFGVEIEESANNVIGGTAAGAGNLISGNNSWGVQLQGANATGNLVRGNFIGTNAAGSGALSNTGGGVLIVDSASNNAIGGAAAGASNRIAFNTGFGVAIAGTSTGNAALANSIFGNAGLGIDLIGDGLTANDAGDGDIGPNNLQNFPVLNPITTAGTVSGALDSTVANAAYPIRLEFFANTACDASGNGEGEVFLGAISISAPGSFTFNYVPVGGKTFITATATDNNGNTSEFSACAQQPTNTPPTITAAAAITRQAGSPAANATIATVNDGETPAGSLTVTAMTVPAGITVSGITNAGGTVTANLAALCTAVTGNNTVVLKVTDPQGASATANLTVNVTANTAPTLSYNDETVVLGGTLTINPATGPSDNGSVASITLQNVAPPTGPTATVNPTTGQVVLTNVNQTGKFNVIIQARDNCNANRTANFRVTVTGSAPALAARAVKHDFDGDGVSDLVTWNAPEGKWQIRRSSDDVWQTEQWGVADDLPVPADYDGDDKADLAVWRAADGHWLIQRSSDGETFEATLGERGDMPMPGDYDGDGKADIAVWRPANGAWHVGRSSDGGFTVEPWGEPGDTPVLGDYDGDGKTDLAVWRGANWHIKYSAGGEEVISWGASVAPYFDVPVPADYDGDGKTDLAVWRGAEGVWYIRRSADGQPFVQRWGTSTAPYFDTPALGDFDGDGKTDLTVWRPADGAWYVMGSSNGASLVRAQGKRGDQPVLGARY